MKVFLDSDVILDLLLDRAPFAEAVTQIFQKSAETSITLSTSPVVITNIYYIIRKLENKQKATELIHKILQLVKVENVGDDEISKALKSGFSDFEDAVQHYCALSSKQELIITRNYRDYKKSKLPVMAPDEFLAKIIQ